MYSPGVIPPPPMQPPIMRPPMMRPNMIAKEQPKCEGTWWPYILFIGMIGALIGVAVLDVKMNTIKKRLKEKEDEIDELEKKLKNKTPKL